MYKNLLFLSASFLFFCASVSAQVNIAFISCADSAMAVFGSGKDNYIRVDHLPARAVVSVDDGLIKSLGSNKYIVYRLGDVKQTLLRVSVGDSVIYSRSVKVARTKYSGSEYNPEIIVKYEKSRGLYVSGDTGCKVVNYVATVLPARGPLLGPQWFALYPWRCGNSPPEPITEAQRQQRLARQLDELVEASFKDSVRRSIVFFDEIKVKCSCCKGRFDINPIQVKLSR